MFSAPAELAIVDSMWLSTWFFENAPARLKLKAELPVLSPPDVFVAARAIVSAKIDAADFGVSSRFWSEPTREPSMAARTCEVMSLIAIDAPMLTAPDEPVARTRATPPPSALISDLSLAINEIGR